MFKQKVVNARIIDLVGLKLETRQFNFLVLLDRCVLVDLVASGGARGTRDAWLHDLLVTCFW